MRRASHAALACVLGLSLALAPVPALAETSAEVRAQAAAVQEELDQLTADIEAGEARVQELQQQVDGLAEESVQIEQQIVVDRDRLAQIVSESYKGNSDARTLALLLSSETVDELISQVYYAQKVSDWQTECVERLKADKQELEQRMDQISQAKDEQKAALVALEGQHDELDAKIADLNDKADRLQAEEEEAARKAAEEARRKAEEAARKAEEERRAREAREAEERARQEALEAARAAGDIDVTPTQDGGNWITCIASAYTIADNDPPGSTATASGIPLDESVPTVAMPMSMNPSRFYGSKIEISYNGMSVVATVTDCGAMGGGSRGLDLTPSIFRAFGFGSADAWGLREVRYRFL